MSSDQNPTLTTGTVLGMSASVALAACTATTGSNADDRAREEFSNALGREPVATDFRFSPSFFVGEVSPRKREVRFFWSPTCSFSAREFVQDAIPLVQTRRFMRQHNFCVLQVARNDTDEEFFARMNTYDRYPDLATLLLRINHQNGVTADPSVVDRIAERFNFRRRSIPEDSTARMESRLAREAVNQLSNHAISVGLSATPTWFVDGEIRRPI